MTRISWCSTTLVVVTTAAIGCAASQDPERVGHIDVPLTAIGPGGAVYRLPPSTSLELLGSSFRDALSLEGDDASVRIDVPPGNYSAFLINPAGFTITWPLSRQNLDGSIDSVQATLDPIPQIGVNENQTTALGIQFHVLGDTVISFTRGTVAVSISVDGSAATSRFELSFDAPMLSFAGTASQSAPPDLAGRFPANGRTVSYTADVETTAPFALQNRTTVCAPAIMRSRGVSLELSDFITEATSDAVSICIAQFSSATLALTIQANRVGPPVTALLADLTDQVVAVNYGVEAFFNAFLFDGTTLQLGPLLGVQSTEMFLFGSVLAFRADQGGFDSWYNVSSDAASQGTSSFTAEPR
jgi:hypothetical protein